MKEPVANNNSASSLSAPPVSPLSAGGSDKDFLLSEGYSDNEFAGKAEQMAEVIAFIKSKGFLPEHLVDNEVTWFYNNLGIDNMYFQMEGVTTIANHIMALYASKMSAFIKDSDGLDINLEQESEERAVYIHSSKPGISRIDRINYEVRIDDMYLDISTKQSGYRVETYRSLGTVSASIKTQLRCYFVQRCDWVNPNPSPEEALDIHQVADRGLLAKLSPATLALYQRMMVKALDRSGPVIELQEADDTRCKRLVFAYRQGTTQKLFSAMSHLYHYYGLTSLRKYVENFSNGVTIMTVFLLPLPNASHPVEHAVLQIMKEASLVYCLPTTPLDLLFKTGALSVQETIYCYCALVFAQHFLNRLGGEYSTLQALLDEKDPVHVEVLTKLKKRLRQETFTREYILDIVQQYPELIKVLYVNFAMSHYVMHRRETLQPSLSFQSLQKDLILTPQQIEEKIRKTVCNQHEQMVFEALLRFNQHVLKTNFYQPTKIALSFRLDPSFLPEVEYPVKPYGMFLVIGSEFRGFHVRFQDIARGGIRIIRSRNRETYSINVRSLFDENYALASTQNRKNKDIPEGGSKGTILLDANQQDKARQSFEKYVDAILDLIILGRTPGIKEKIVDRLGKPEILFFGPDEGTADYMDWASQHARIRGASFWKAFTTGKSQSLGGIPHDLFGMTTHSIHAYVTGIYAKLGLDEKTVHKFQTGGPDGDLGSNEIKISHDRTIAIVDGSGVLYDPEGLDRTELERLATKRQMIANFDTGRLGPSGFRVLIDDMGITLPDGTVVEDGLKFRNEFHLLELSSADLFVPCGGRPEAVDINNVHRLFHADGTTPRFKYIVEGANLFFTQEARIRLEHAGCIIFKDASANKGGVTSSSLEVLAALALTDEEFAEHMMVKEGVVPPFYSAYIKAVHEIIERNARLEFECLWKENEEQPGRTRSVLSDELSYAILALNTHLQESNSLWENEELRKLILADAIPKLLQDQVGGVEVLMKRLPESYLRALFGSYLASRFVYKHGINPGQFAFYEFMDAYNTRLRGCK